MTVVISKYKPFLTCTSWSSLTVGRGTPLSGSWIILTRTSIVTSLSVRDVTLAHSRTPPTIRAALRGSTFFFFNLTFVRRGVASSAWLEFGSLSSLEESAQRNNNY